VARVTPSPPRSFARVGPGYATGMTHADAILIGGPRDGFTFSAESAGLVELEIEGLVHRYIPTSQHRTDGGTRRAVYTYDGVVDPDGALDGAEHSRQRRASPLGDRLEHEDGAA
jgi:hypothetical protein